MSTRYRKNVSMHSDTMIVSVYLAVDSSGGTRISVNPPALKPNEIKVALNLKIPKAIFKKPSLEATLEIPEGAGMGVITPKIQQQIKDAVYQSVGMELSVRVKEPE